MRHSCFLHISQSKPALHVSTNARAVIAVKMADLRTSTGLPGSDNIHPVTDQAVHWKAISLTFVEYPKGSHLFFVHWLPL